MGETSKDTGTIRTWYGLAAGAVLLLLAMLAGGGWLAWQWVRQNLPPAAQDSTWWHLMALPLLLGLVAALAMLLLSQRGVRQAREAATARAAWQSETRRRQVAEEALRHAQKMEAVGRLTGGIAHDFNNHLTVISSNVELLQRRLPGCAPELTRLMDAATQGVRRAATLTQRLLAFSRPQTLDPEPVDARHLVTGMLDLLRRTLGEKIAVDTRPAANLWQTRVDSNQLESALLNLAVNARDAMPDGGRLTIETANVTLDASSGGAQPDRIPGQYVMIAVHDTGQGTSQDMRARALEPFFTTRPPGDSTGLGLTMVRDFVGQSGGHVKIESQPGKGTTIRMYLPRHAQPAMASADASGRHAPGDGETVLVVEDDDPVRDAAAEALREIGYQVLEAPDAMEAVRLLADRGGVDLLFTDVGLPGGVNGRALADAARNINPALKVLFTTGYKGDALEQCGLSHESEQFLAKPFTLQQLEAKVREILDAPAQDDAIHMRTESA